MSQGVGEKVGILTAIESEGHFGAIGLQMLGAHTMPATHNAALQKREGAFDCVGMRLAAILDVNAQTVPDSLVPPVLSQVLCRATVLLVVVGEKHVHVLRDILADVLFKGARPCVFGMEKAEIAAALANADDDFFVGVSSCPSPADVSTANPGFVHFNLTIQHRPLALNHGVSDAMAEIPSCLVASESERALNLASRHALLGFAEKQRGDEPLCQRQMAIIENRSCRHGELVVTVLAVEQLFLGLKLDSGHLAARALRASGPAEPDKQFAAPIFGSEHGVYVN